MSASHRIRRAPRTPALSEPTGNDNAGAQVPAPAWVLVPGAAPANDEREADADALLAQDPEFDAVCDERRAAWIDALEHETEFEAACASARALPEE